jgi:hypothetical protein
MKKPRNRCLIAIGFLLLCGVTGKAELCVRSDTPEITTALRQFAVSEVPFHTVEQAGDFADKPEHKEIIQKRLSEARKILPSFKGLRSEDAQNTYMVQNTNLYVRRILNDRVVVTRIPLGPDARQCGAGDAIIIWAQSGESAAKERPSAWRSPSENAAAKTWLAGVMGEIVGAKVEVVLVNPLEDGTADAVCYVWAESSTIRYAKVRVFPDGIKVVISMEEPVITYSIKPVGSNARPLKYSPIIFPPGWTNVHER